MSVVCFLHIMCGTIILCSIKRSFPLSINFQYKQKPPIVLLDCSKLQLGRGRIDDTVSSFRRRLELFRELTLPMLKTMDTDGRLTIVSNFFIFLK